MHELPSKHLTKMLSPSQDMSTALLRCLSSETSILRQPTHDDSFAPQVDGSLQFCHFNTRAFSMGDLHHDPSSMILEYLTPPPPLPPPCLSSNSSTTSDEAEEQQLMAIDERKRRRMISNRESARRSRMRKQRQLGELRSHIVRLLAENRDLVDRLDRFAECHDQVLEENARLREEVSDLRQMRREARINCPADNTTDPGVQLGHLLHDNIIMSNY